MPYTHLTENERYVISHLKVAGFTLRDRFSEKFKVKRAVAQRSFTTFSLCFP